MKRSFIIALLLTLLLGLGIFIGYKKLDSWRAIKKEESATVLLERIEKVSKLITVEGQFSEIYSYKDHYYYDIPLFRKKALLRVKARVSAGFDFDRLDITIDEKSSHVIIDSFPPATILSLEHDLEYYDMQEGTFNSFTEEELSQIQRQAKDFVIKKAEDSAILQEAEAQKAEYLEMLSWVLESMGWMLKVRSYALVD